MDVDNGTVARRHTFSGYKRRKRIPPHTAVAADTSKLKKQCCWLQY